VSEFFSGIRGELLTAVQDDFIMEIKVGKDMLEKKGSDTGGINRFGTRNENHPLHKFMIDHD